MPMFPPEMESTKVEQTLVRAAPSWWHTPVVGRYAYLHTSLAFALAFAAAIYTLAGISWHLAFAPLGGMLIAFRWVRAFDTPAGIYGTAAVGALILVPIMWLRAH